VVVTNPEIPTDMIKAKHPIFDLNCNIADEQGGMEMRARVLAGDKKENRYAGERNRIVLDLCRLHSDQKAEGEEYRKLKRTSFVLITTRSIDPGSKKLIERYTLRTESAAEFSNMITLVVMDLTQVHTFKNKSVGEMTDAQRLAFFVRRASDPKSASKIAEICKECEEIAMLYSTLTAVSQDEKVRAFYRDLQKSERDARHEAAYNARIAREPVSLRRETRPSRRQPQKTLKSLQEMLRSLP
jgi:hypothetical protein